jgi:hypothetical protein
MNELVLYPSKLKTILIAAGALIFVCSGLSFVIWQDEVGLSFWMIVICSWVGIPFFGFGFLYACYRLIVPKPALIVNHEGIFDNASAISAGLVKWDEIADVFVSDFMGQSFLSVVPVDIEAFLQRQPVFKIWLMKANAGLVAAPINIPQSMLRMKVEELASEIQKYRQKRSGLKG